jgi:uncharacterized alpha-E superfamily protein
MISRARGAEPDEIRLLVRLHKCLNSRHSKLSKAKNRRPTPLEFERELISVISDVKRTDSLAFILSEVSRVGNNVRERLSSDMMILIAQLRTSVEAPPDTHILEYPAILTLSLEFLSAFSGMERENINRGIGWLFMSIGRRLERAIYLTRMLRQITLPLGEKDWPLLECLLEVADSSMTYRSRYYTTLQPMAVVDVLMADGSNPRSLDFQIAHLADQYQRLPRPMTDDLEAMQEALKMLRGFDLHALSYSLPSDPSAAKDTEGLARLENFLAGLERLLPSWSDNLSSRYFSHARTFPISIGL